MKRLLLAAALATTTLLLVGCTTTPTATPTATKTSIFTTKAYAAATYASFYNQLYGMRTSELKQLETVLKNNGGLTYVSATSNITDAQAAKTITELQKIEPTLKQVYFPFNGNLKNSNAHIQLLSYYRILIQELSNSQDQHLDMQIADPNNIQFTGSIAKITGVKIISSKIGKTTKPQYVGIQPVPDDILTPSTNNEEEYINGRWYIMTLFFDTKMPHTTNPTPTSETFTKASAAAAYTNLYNHLYDIQQPEYKKLSKVILDNDPNLSANSNAPRHMTEAQAKKVNTELETIEPYLKKIYPISTTTNSIKPATNVQTFQIYERFILQLAQRQLDQLSISIANPDAIQLDTGGQFTQVPRSIVTLYSHGVAYKTQSPELEIFDPNSTDFLKYIGGHWLLAL